MSAVYWIIASLLALFYFYSGGIKVFRTKDQLRPMMAWIDTVPLAAIRVIGGLEIAGGLGLILPPLLRTAPGLAVAAALGLVLLQIGGIVLHIRRGEGKAIGLSIALLIAAIASALLATSAT